jgi:transcriptional regulator with XRE-family HTH domain
MQEKNLAIDVDIVIDLHNRNNPKSKQLNRRLLAEMLDVNKQVFSDWKSDKKPTNKMVGILERLAEIGKCPISHFIVDQNENGEYEINVHSVLIEKKDDEWTCSLFVKYCARQQPKFVDIVTSKSFSELIVKMGEKNWIDLLNLNR